jgi:hypothetical protein
VLKTLRELNEIALAIDGEDDGVRVGRQAAGRSLAGGVNELGGEIAKGEVSADQAVVVERLRRSPVLICGADSIGRLRGVTGAGSPVVSLGRDAKCCGSWTEGYLGSRTDARGRLPEVARACRSGRSGSSLGRSSRARTRGDRRPSRSPARPRRESRTRPCAHRPGTAPAVRRPA